MKKLPLDAITGARFFAALYVLVFHYFFLDNRIKFVLASHLPWPIVNFLDRGPVAVNFFFVLSGFILTYNYSSPQGEMNASKHDFWLARFARVVPMYLVALLIATPFYFQDVFHSRPPGESLLAIAGNMAVNFIAGLTFLNAWAPGLNDINPPGWTLSAEAFFYLVFPFVVGRLGRFSNAKLLRAAAFLYFLSLVPTLLFQLWVPCGPNVYNKTATHDQYVIATVLYNLPLLRIPDFLVGMMLGLAFNRAPADAPPGFWSKPWLAVSAYVAALMLITFVPWPAFRPCFCTPFSAWVIWALARNRASLIARGLSLPAMVLLGEASYGVYLFHFTLMMYMERRTVAAGFDFTLPVIIVLFLIVVTVVTSFATLLFFVVEEPARRWIRKRYQRGKVPIHPAASALG